FFFQAEVGIRDFHVTGVQTCALPIYIGSEGCKYICEALKSNSTLSVLDLWGNNIGSEGCKYICEALKSNSTLSQLNLRGNKIGEIGRASCRERVEWSGGVE